MSYTLEEKIKIIQDSNNMGDIPLDAMPYMQSDEYYFVSYSHRDYKKVYSDILRLQNLGLNVWYDRGLPAGKNWQDMADEAISKHSCVGVIFYLSENSLLSDAVEREILFVNGKQKDYLSINIPLEEGGKSISASDMLKALECKKQFSQRKKQIIDKAFGNSVLFIDYAASAEFKAEKIKLLKKPPVLQYEIKYDRLKGGRIAVVDNVLDLFAKQISVPYSIEFDGCDVPVREINECAFANCKYLKSVSFAKKSKLVMKARAFYGCNSLEEIDVHNFSEIGDYAFSCCSALKKITLSSNTQIGNGVFGGTKLNQIKIVKKSGKTLIEGSTSDRLSKELRSTLIGSSNLKKYGYAFNEKVLLYDTPTESGKLEITLYGNGSKQEEEQTAFDNSDLTVFAIGDSAFANRENVKMVTMIPTTRVIGERAFENCINLSEFNYVASHLFMQMRYCLGYNRAIMTKQDFENKPLCIGEYAFSGCSSMERIFIPPYVKINEFSFANCFNLQVINFLPLKQFPCVYSDCKNAYVGEYSFFRCISLTKVEIPITISEIKQFAFGECKNLSTVILHGESNLRCIDKTAFFGCKNLNEISFNGTIEQFLQIKQTGIGKKLQEVFAINCIDGRV